MVSLQIDLISLTLHFTKAHSKSCGMCRSNKGWIVLCWRNGMHG